MKCYRCKIDKPADSFNRDRSKASGRKSVCRDCDRAKAHSYYVSNRDHVLARTGQASQEQYARNRDEAIAVYGGKCSWCGSVNDLEFDHDQNDGGEHRQAETLPSMLRRIAKAGRPVEDRSLRLLCRDCHRGPGWKRRRDAAHNVDEGVTG